MTACQGIFSYVFFSSECIKNNDDDDDHDDADRIIKNILKENMSKLIYELIIQKQQ